MRWLGDLLGTLQNSFGIGPKGLRFTLDASGLSANRTATLQNATGTIAYLADTYLTVTAANADFTYASGDENVGYGKTTGTARNYTVDASLLKVGAFYYGANYASAGNVLLLAAVGTTMRLAGTATTGTRTVGPFGRGRIWVRSANEVWIDGPGVT